MALKQYVKGENLASVIHLAGAADELLGKIVEINKNKNALARAQRWMRSWYQISGKDTPANKYLNMHILKIKNGIKHINDASDLQIEFNARKEAKEAIRRAIENYNQIPALKPSEELLAYYSHDRK